MSASLNPSSQTIAAIKNSIQNTLKSNIAPEVLPSVVAPLVSTVNTWSTQIPSLLESVSSINQIFDIRSLIFVGPRFTQNVFDVPFTELPPAFQEFMAFIHKLIEAQKVHKDKPAPKVHFLSVRALFCLLLDHQAGKRPGRTIKSKPVVDDDDSVEILTPIVSETPTDVQSGSSDDVVCFVQLCWCGRTAIDELCGCFTQAMVLDDNPPPPVDTAESNTLVLDDHPKRGKLITFKKVLCYSFHPGATYSTFPVLFIYPVGLREASRGKTLRLL
jgi:hypothetical protein